MKNTKKPESYIYYLKCQPCQLEFVVFSWAEDWPEKTNSFCPECGKQETHLLRREASEKMIYDLNCE